jgi:hypothetical protein
MIGIKVPVPVPMTYRWPEQHHTAEASYHFPAAA